MEIISGSFPNFESRNLTWFAQFWKKKQLPYSYLFIYLLNKYLLNHYYVLDFCWGYSHSQDNQEGCG